MTDEELTNAVATKVMGWHREPGLEEWHGDQWVNEHGEWQWGVDWDPLEDDVLMDEVLDVMSGLVDGGVPMVARVATMSELKRAILLAALEACPCDD